MVLHDASPARRASSYQPRASARRAGRTTLAVGLKPSADTTKAACAAYPQKRASHPSYSATQLLFICDSPYAQRGLGRRCLPKINPFRHWARALPVPSGERSVLGGLQALQTACIFQWECRLIVMCLRGFIIFRMTGSAERDIHVSCGIMPVYHAIMNNAAACQAHYHCHVHLHRLIQACQAE